MSQSVLDFSSVSLVSVCAQDKAGRCSSGVVEMKSLGRFALGADPREQSGFTSLGTFPLTTMDNNFTIYTPMSQTGAVSVGTFEFQANPLLAESEQ